MATSTNVGVKDKGTNGKLTFDIPSSLQSGDCSFFFKSEGDQQQGIFQLKVKDELVRENVSQPFASGALKILGIHCHEKTVKNQLPSKTKGIFITSGLCTLIRL